MILGMQQSILCQGSKTNSDPFSKEHNRALVSRSPPTPACPSRAG